MTSSDTSYSSATANSVIVTVTDNDDPQVTVQFAQAAYTVAEGGTRSVTVRLSADPERTVVIPLVATGQGADTGDFSVPATVTFAAGDTSKMITFSATDDTVDDDDESVLLTFGPEPAVRGERGDDGHDHGEHRRRRRPAGDGAVRAGGLHGC